MNVYLLLFLLYLFLFPIVNCSIYLENDCCQGRLMSKKLHNFDLQGLQWGRSRRPRGSGHNNEPLCSESSAKSDAASPDASKFVFRAGADDFEHVDEIASLKLAESLKNLRIPNALEGGSSRDKGHECHCWKGKQDKVDDVVKGGLTKWTESKKPVSEKDSDDVKLIKVVKEGIKIAGSVNSQGARRWNLRDRKSIKLSRAASSNPSAGSSIRGLNKGKEKLQAADLNDNNSGNKGKTEMLMLPYFSIALTPEEITEDLTEMLGKPPPKKVKKRPRNIQKHLDLIFPGLTLGNTTLDRYMVPENPNGKGK